jgi:hypothetical protein
MGTQNETDVQLYRLNWLEWGARIPRPSIQFTATDDTEAFRVARRVLDCHPVELWQGSRLVARLCAFPDTVYPEAIIVIAH